MRVQWAEDVEDVEDAKDELSSEEELGGPCPFEERRAKCASDGEILLKGFRADSFDLSEPHVISGETKSAPTTPSRGSLSTKERLRQKVRRKKHSRRKGVSPLDRRRAPGHVTRLSKRVSDEMVFASSLTDQRKLRSRLSSTRRRRHSEEPFGMIHSQSRTTPQLHLTLKGLPTSRQSSDEPVADGRVDAAAVGDMEDVKSEEKSEDGSAAERRSTPVPALEISDSGFTTELSVVQWDTDHCGGYTKPAMFAVDGSTVTHTGKGTHNIVCCPPMQSTDCVRFRVDQVMGHFALGFLDFTEEYLDNGCSIDSFGNITACGIRAVASVGRRLKHGDVIALKVDAANKCVFFSLNAVGASVGVSWASRTRMFYAAVMCAAKGTQITLLP